MQIRRPRGLTLALAALSAAALVACGGGGGGSSVAPTPVPTAAPTPTPVATPTPSTALASGACSTALTNCVYTFRSVPAGLQVVIDGTLAGVTPLSTSPPFTSSPHTVAIGTQGYSFSFVQSDTTASRTFVYDQAADTGTVNVTGTQSAGREIAAAGGAPEPRRGVASFAGPSVVPDGLYVRYEAARLKALRPIDRIESDAGVRAAYDVLSPVAAVRGRVLRFASGTDLAAASARLAAEAGVAGVYPLHYRHALAATAQVPNDPYFSGFTVNTLSPSTVYQWDLKTIHADYAWSYTQGRSAKVAILDTGVDLTHPDLKPLIAYQANAANRATSTGGPNTVDTSAGAAQDTNGHGSNVAGIAAANTNDGIGFAGVAYQAKLYAYRIFPNATSTSDQQSADTGDEALAIADAVRQGVDVINLSIGAAAYDSFYGTGFDTAEYNAIEAAISAGVTVVAAAGNEGAATLDYPAGYDGVISVGASALKDNNTAKVTGATEYVASYSNTGPGLSVVAPGGDSANNSDLDFLHWIINDSTTTAALASDQCRVVSLPDVCKSLFNGTSQATPHVTGTVALVQSALREAGKAALTPGQMKLLIEGTADNINDAKQGHGRLDTLRAVESALGVSLTLPAPPSSPAQFVAFAYTNVNTGSNVPQIADTFYTKGVPVSATGAFRIADIDPNATTTTYRIGVWLDANGNGKIDAGDQFGAASATCVATAACQPGTIVVKAVTAGFTLP